MKDFISMVKANKSGFVLSVMLVYLIGCFNTYSQASSVLFSLFASSMIFCHKYFLISMLNEGVDKNKFGRYIAGYFKLYPVFIVYAILFVSVVSICSAFIPELVPWGEKVLSGIAAGGVNEDLNLHLEALAGANIINSVVAIFIAVILMVYVLFAVLTTSVIMYKTNKFFYSLLTAFGFVICNWKTYLFVFAPLLISAFAVIILIDVDLLPLVEVFIVYRLLSLFENKFGKK
jgi:hypothetical protein